MRNIRFNISTGVVEFTFPMTLTMDDAQDIKDAMAITFRVMERIATNGQPAYTGAACKVRIPELVPDRNSSSGFRVA